MSWYISSATRPEDTHNVTDQASSLWDYFFGDDQQNNNSVPASVGVGAAIIANQRRKSATGIPVPEEGVPYAKVRTAATATPTQQKETERLKSSVELLFPTKTNMMESRDMVMQQNSSAETEEQDLAPTPYVFETKPPATLKKTASKTLKIETQHEEKPKPKPAKVDTLVTKASTGSLASTRSGTSIKSMPAFVPTPSFTVPPTHPNPSSTSLQQEKPPVPEPESLSVSNMQTSSQKSLPLVNSQPEPGALSHLAHLMPNPLAGTGSLDDVSKKKGRKRPTSLSMHFNNPFSRSRSPEATPRGSDKEKEKEKEPDTLAPEAAAVVTSGVFSPNNRSVRRVLSFGGHSKKDREEDGKDCDVGLASSPRSITRVKSGSGFFKTHSLFHKSKSSTNLDDSKSKSTTALPDVGGKAFPALLPTLESVDLFEFKK
eukprot:comp15263_c0_seq1/m.12044 comp15263_c0_seq1/g.12044  ORF comp15263_c0_seq1/g.12044 comp15263_c0_seq1/m.12044 type:complete len:430 (-) comp15263_c0_seq1:177-1466(-)